MSSPLGRALLERAEPSGDADGTNAASGKRPASNIEAGEVADRPLPKGPRSDREQPPPAPAVFKFLAPEMLAHAVEAFASIICEAAGAGGELDITELSDPFPGTGCRIACLVADNTEGIVEGMKKVLSIVAQCGGCASNRTGEYLFTAVMPAKSCAMLIGVKGQNIKDLVKTSGAHVHVEGEALGFSTGSGPGGDKLVQVKGPYQGMEFAVMRLIECVLEFQDQPWFPDWVVRTNTERLEMIAEENQGGKNSKLAKANLVGKAGLQAEAGFAAGDGGSLGNVGGMAEMADMAAMANMCGMMMPCMPFMMGGMPCMPFMGMMPLMGMGMPGMAGESGVDDAGALAFEGGAAGGSADMMGALGSMASNGTMGMGLGSAACAGGMGGMGAMGGMGGMGGMGVMGGMGGMSGMRGMGNPGRTGGLGMGGNGGLPGAFRGGRKPGLNNIPAGIIARQVKGTLNVGRMPNRTPDVKSSIPAAHALPKIMARGKGAPLLRDSGSADLVTDPVGSTEEDPENGLTEEEMALRIAQQNREIQRLRTGLTHKTQPPGW